MAAPKDPIKYEKWRNGISLGHKGKPWTEKQRESMKNRPPPWNKGKTGIYSQELLNKMSISRIGKKASDETRKKQSLCRIGPKNYFYGKHHNENSKELIRKSKLGKPCKLSPEGRQNIINGCKNRIWSEESLRKISLSKIGKPRPEHVKQAMLKASIGRIPSQETRKKISAAGLGRRWSEHSKQKLREKRKNWKIPFVDSKPERMMQIALALNGIKFEKHKPFQIGKRWHQVDIFIEPNIVVEVDGVKWHIPIDRIKRDLFINQELTIMGYHVIRIRDKDILKNTQNCAQKVVQLINELQHKTIHLG